MSGDGVRRKLLHVIVNFYLYSDEKQKALFEGKILFI